MARAPRISVLMTLYNKGPYVEEAVQSVLGQTFTDFELLVVDDASTDDGPARVRSIGDPRIRFLESAVNTGRPAAANRGYDAARGEYVAVLDADDKMHPERLAKQLAYLEAHPNVAILGTWAQAFGASDQVLMKPAGDAACRARFLLGMSVLYPTTMLRRSFMEQHGVRCRTDWLYPGMDRLLLIEAGQYGAYANLQEVLTYYRVGTQNMRHGRNPLHDLQALYRATFDFFSLPATDRELGLLAYLHEDVGETAPSGREVAVLHRSIKRLLAYNRQHGVVPADELEADVRKRWHGLFYRLVEQDSAATLLHMALTGHLRRRFGYWAKVTKDRWLGR